MPITLPNGKYRIQIRIKGHPRIDQVFDTRRAATDQAGLAGSAQGGQEACDGEVMPELAGMPWEAWLQ